MRLRQSLVGFIIVCGALTACGSDDGPAAVGSDSTVALSPADNTSAGDATVPAAAAGGDVDCAALKDNLASMLINWQVVIGMSNSPTSEWAQIPLGSITKFGDQLTAITAALGTDADAASSLSFMSGAYDIVQRGLGGDTAAQADLAAYMGTDITANVSKQIPISIAFDNTDCD